MPTHLISQDTDGLRHRVAECPHQGLFEREGMTIQLQDRVLQKQDGLHQPFAERRRQAHAPVQDESNKEGLMGAISNRL